MKKIVVLFMLVSAIAQAQQDAWVYFTNKPNAEYYLANPLEMLSQKALDRRAAQGIALDDKDVPVYQDYVNGITAASGITVMAKSKWLNALHVRGEQEQITALSNFTYVDHIEFANHALNNSRVMQPSQQLQPQTTLEDYNYGNAVTQVQMLNAHILHQQGYTGDGITIAVMDAGFPGVDTAQPFQHLVTNGLILGGYDFVGNSANFYTGGNHGTRVLSTIGANAEGQMVGTAPNAAFYLFITEDITSENPVEESYWVEAAERADSLGVDIISTSLGYFDYDNPAYNYTYSDMNGQTAFMSRGAAIAFTRGMVLVTSAGNDGNQAEPHISTPADAVNTLTVGAVDSSEVYATFSSIGPSSDGRIKPDVMAMGFASAYANPDGSISAGNGTSFSAPIMAGAVACLWQAYPDLTNAQILQVVRQSADRYSNPNNQYGYGIPDFATALELALNTTTFISQTLKVYPNPASTIVHFSAVADTAVLYNTVGQEVLRAKSTDSIDITNLQAGVYFYTVTAENKQTTGKLIKL